MTHHSGPEDIRNALNAFAEGDRNKFKSFFSEHPLILHTYDGPGDVFNYLIPALFVKEFCMDLIDAGFPVEEVFAENLQDLAWTAWPAAIEHVARTRPQILMDLSANGLIRQDDLYGFAFMDPEHDDYQMVMDVLPPSLQEATATGAQKFASMEDEHLADLYANVMEVVEGPLMKNHPQPVEYE